MLDELIGILAPHNCIRCGLEGDLLCEQCLPKATSTKRSSCYLCNALTLNWQTCKRCGAKTKISGVIVASHYEGEIKELVRQLKYQHTVAAAKILGELIATRVTRQQFDVVTAIPASSQRFRQRGYNQALLIGKTVAWLLNVPFAELLGRTGQVRQVGTNRRQRLQQMAGQMYARRSWLVKNYRILVIDDVVTTGATLSEAGRALKLAGSKQIWGAAAAKH